MNHSLSHPRQRGLLLWGLALALVLSMGLYGVLGARADAAAHERVASLPALEPLASGHGDAMPSGAGSATDDDALTGVVAPTF